MENGKRISFVWDIKEKLVKIKTKPNLMKTTTLPTDHQWKQGEREETEQDRHSFCRLHR